MRDLVKGRLLVGVGLAAVGPSMIGFVQVTELLGASEGTYAVVVDDLRDDGDLSGEGARFEEVDCSTDVG